MIADVLTLSAVTAEILTLAGSRIDRIYQPSRYEALLYLFQRGAKKCLLLSAHPQRSRIHLTGQPYEHPKQPTSFCMLLRKYLAGGIIREIKRPPLERILFISARSLEGIWSVELIAEMMGRRSNLILVNEERRILGALKYSSREQNRYRDILPGKIYIPPPLPDKQDPLKLNPEALALELGQKTRAGMSPQKALLELVQGISPLVSDELVFRARWDQEQPERSARYLAEELKELFRNHHDGQYEPCWVLTENKYASYRLTHLDSSPTNYRSMNELLDDYYYLLAEDERTGNLRRSLQACLGKKMARAERKLAEQHLDLKRAEDKDRFRLYGETLLAYAYRVPLRAAQVELPDPYRTDNKVLISLDPRLTASGNAQRYFKLYQKAKQTAEKSNRQLRKTEAEIAHYQQILGTIEKADYSLLLLIHRQISPDRALPSPKKTAPKPATGLPLLFRSSEGNIILVGRNQRQNDFLTFKLASRQDTWLHVRELSGSHVLIKDTPFPPPPSLLEEAALLAAHFSRGSESTTVDVDYTIVKNVRRPPGGKPGQVLYTDYRTVTVRPDGERLGKLLNK